jgi:hypothetical protein
MQCPTCASDVPAKAHYCSKCGHQVPIKPSYPISVEALAQELGTNTDWILIRLKQEGVKWAATPLGSLTFGQAETVREWFKNPGKKKPELGFGQILFGALIMAGLAGVIVGMACRSERVGIITTAVVFVVLAALVRFT